MKLLLAISSISLAVTATGPASAENSMLSALAQYVPESVLSLMSEQQIFTAFSISTSRDTDAQKATQIEYIATSSAEPRTYSRQQLDLVSAYLTPEQMSRMDAADIGNALALIHSSKTETEKRGLIRALADY
ncbi:hypothetical protein PVT71_16675 [Salipiger sp. H15]|uniref:DUF2059 domain-containing protein n=1 Tax=Alloyangia sp. H15 TaxID=3029062 RepID=A0AAU8APA1_9RHOB